MLNVKCANMLAVGDQDSLIKAANDKLTAIYEKEAKRDSGKR